MFKKAILLAMAILLFTCIGLVGCAAPIRGSGDVAEEKREVRGFDRVQLDGMGEVIVTQGDEDSIIIEADDNLLEFIQTTVRGDELVINIKARRPLVPTKPMRFYVTMEDIEGLALDGTGSIRAEGIETEIIEFDVNGAGDITIDDLEAEMVDVEIDGIGNLELNGSATHQSISIDGAGNYDGKGLESDNASISIDGIGNATLDVADTLNVDINGSGKVTYSGDPNIDQSINGLGRVSKR